VLRDDCTVTFFVTKSTDSDDVQKAKENVRHMKSVPFEPILRKAERFEGMVAAISEVWFYIFKMK
jgi:hypothetical protein